MEEPTVHINALGAPLSGVLVNAAARLPGRRPEGLTLGAYLQRRALCALVWGLNDCLLWTATWAWSQGHPDAAAPFRGRYSTREAAMRIVSTGGGMLAVARAGAARAGLAEIDAGEARPGDIGLGVLGESGWPGEPCGLIRAGAYWAAVSRGVGVTIGEAEIVAAWRV